MLGLSKCSELFSPSKYISFSAIFVGGALRKFNDVHFVFVEIASFTSTKHAIE
jgi:hypothetical protein